MADFSSEWSKISKKKQSAEGASFPFNLVPVLPGENQGKMSCMVEGSSGSLYWFIAVVPMARVVLGPSVCTEEPHGETQKARTVP